VHLSPSPPRAGRWIKGIVLLMLAACRLTRPFPPECAAPIYLVGGFPSCTDVQGVQPSVGGGTDCNPWVSLTDVKAYRGHRTRRLVPTVRNSRSIVAPVKKENRFTTSPQGKLLDPTEAGKCKRKGRSEKLRLPWSPQMENY
jgi:hypothetical protein